MARRNRKRQETREPDSRMWEGSDGRWHSYIHVGRKADGSPDRRHREAATEEELRPKVLEVESSRDTGTLSRAGRSRTLEDWLTYWAKEIAPNQNRPRTVSRYESNVRNYLIPGLGQWRLSEIKKRHFAEFYLNLTRSGELSPSTIRNIHRTASAALGWALELDEPGLTTNPAQAARKSLPTLDESHVIPLDADEIARILRVVAPMRNHVRWWLAFLGARQGETLGLKDIDLFRDPGIVKIRRQLQRHTFRHGCDDPKACASQRCITGESCEVGCRKRVWLHGCKDKRACAAVHCERPQYPSDVARGVKPRNCSPDCTGHARGCPQRRRSACRINSHREGCPKNCTGHASHCPERLGGLTLTETKELSTKKPTRRSRRSRREIRPKSEAGNRRMPLPGEVWDEMEVHLARQEMEKLEAGDAWEDNGFLFTNQFGQPIDPRRDWERWGEILDEADVEYIELHGARHSAATFLGSLGVDPVVCMAMLGWASPEMAKRYQHVPDAALVEAANRLGSAAFKGFSATDTATGELKRLAIARVRTRKPLLTSNYL